MFLVGVWGLVTIVGKRMTVIRRVGGKEDLTESVAEIFPTSKEMTDRREGGFLDGIGIDDTRRRRLPQGRDPIRS